MMKHSEFSNQENFVLNRDLEKKQYKTKQVSSLVEALSVIAQDVNSYGYKQMIEILEADGKIKHNGDEEKEVDLRKLDISSLNKLQSLANDHCLV